MADKKTILEEALLDINKIQEALDANTKEILRSVAKEEIDSVVKESLERGYEEEDVDTMEIPTDDVEGPVADDSEEMTMDYSNEEGLEGQDELGMGDMESSDDLDMTAASDDEVIAIYKKLSGDDEIEIVGDEIHMNISEPGEYVVKLDGNGADVESDELDLEPAMDMGDDVADMGGELDGESEEDGVEYEIEMDDEDEESTDVPDDLVPADEEDVEDEEGSLDEKIKIGTGMSVGSRANLGNAPLGTGALEESIKAKKLVSETTKKYNSLLTEATKLKGENEEFRKALKTFRTKLVETVVFNTNLAYVTNLFLEHSTTKAEKDTILKRFDEIGSIKESKRLFKSIESELTNRKPITESLENKIIKEATTSSSSQLNESTAYVDPSTQKIMDLIKRVEKR